MGYHISRHSVIRNKPQLQVMFNAQATVRFQTRNPRNLSYKLREAMRSASKIEEFKKYNRLIHDYSIKEGAEEVIALFHGSIGQVEIKSRLTQQENKEPFEEKKTVPESITLIDVFGTMLQHESYNELRFPNVILNEKEQEALFKWTEDKDWKYIDHAGSGITLTKNIVPEEILWLPSSQEQM